MAISSEMIKKLRDQTGAGMMDCKRALESTAGDFEAAVEYLRKKGAAVAAKRADRTAREGVIVTRVSGDGKTGVILEVNAETDFVGRSEDFTGFAGTVAGLIERHRPATREALLALKSDGGKSVTDMLNDLLSKVGEKIEVRRYEVIRADDGAVHAYTHLGSKIGVLVEVAGPAAKETGRNIAMQVAAMNPMVVKRDDLPKNVIEHELDIYRTQAKNEGKPAQVVDRIATGRLEKFYQEVALLDQIFIKDSGKTVRDVLQDAGAGVQVRRFVRYHLGEEQRPAP
jgi:elongation factor Ts